MITGTPANLVVLSTLEADYGSGYENIIYNIHDIYNIYNIYNVPRSGHPLSYASWMGWAVPLMVVNTSLAWLLLCTLLRLVRNTLACFQTIIQTAINNQSIHRVSGDSKTGGDTGQAERVRGVILARRRALGPPSLQESAVLGLFLLLIALLFFQSPKFMPGWADADIFTGETHRSRHTPLLRSPQYCPPWQGAPDPPGAGQRHSCGAGGGAGVRAAEQAGGGPPRPRPPRLDHRGAEAALGRHTAARRGLRTRRYHR